MKEHFSPDFLYSMGSQDQSLCRRHQVLHALYRIYPSPHRCHSPPRHQVDTPPLIAYARVQTLIPSCHPLPRGRAMGRCHAASGASGGSWGGCSSCCIRECDSCRVCLRRGRACASCGRSSWQIVGRSQDIRKGRAFHLQRKIVSLMRSSSPKRYA